MFCDTENAAQSHVSNTQEFFLFKNIEIFRKFVSPRHYYN